jgi:hypothetical protein
MAFSYNFSVGKISVGNNDLGITKEINVTYDGNPQSFYGGDYRLPLAVELGNRTGEIVTQTARFDSADTVLDNRYLDVTLAAGINGGGLTGTINNCKVTKYDVKSTQDGFVIGGMTLHITSQQAQAAVRGGSWPAWV